MHTKRKRVMITGSNGLLGQKLIDLYLTLPDVELIATAQGENRHPIKEGYVFASMDITQHEQVKALVMQFQPATIINTAAMTNVDACETEQELCRALNVDAVANLANCANQANAHLIHLSTDFIFDGTKKLYEETDAAAPISFYGQSKWDGECAAIETARRCTILRTVIVYGVVHKMSRNNIVLWAYQSLRDKKPMNVVHDQFRTPTLAEDLALGCRLAEQKEATGIFNICGKDFMSILELVQRVAAHFGFSTDSVTATDSASLNQPAKRPPITGLSIEKARRELGYEPHSFEQGLDIVYQQMKQEEA